jgi:hypothetical protein
LKKALLCLMVILTTVSGYELKNLNQHTEVASEDDPGAMHSIELTS